MVATMNVGVRATRTFQPENAAPPRDFVLSEGREAFG